MLSARFKIIITAWSTIPARRKMIIEKALINWYSHVTRYYNPQLALWHSSDPLSELYTSFSPYNYVANNPANYIDPNGMSLGKGPSAEERQKIKEGLSRY